MKVQLLLGSAEFWARLKQDLSEARDVAYLQTLSFEGDRVGTRLGRALERCSAADRRLLVDGYSLLYHSDRVIPGIAWMDRALRTEVAITHRWVRRLERAGVGVRFCNPLGPSPIRLFRRNHKKVAVFDGRVAYLGGINFSDHNFAWHDMMFRVESEGFSRLMTEDFLGTWDGRPVAYDRAIGPVRLISLNGRGNRDAFAPLVAAMRQAEHSIDVVSAYLSQPFTDYLAEAAARGVVVRVLTPAENNKANFAHHIAECAARGGFELLNYVGGMNHMKAMLIDGRLLVAGSSNFDFMSYDILEEHVLMTRYPPMVESFVDRVWHPEVERATRPVPKSTFGSRLGDAAVRLGAGLAARAALPATEEV